jgi:hypothetical protein
MASHCRPFPTLQTSNIVLSAEAGTSGPGVACCKESRSKDGDDGMSKPQPHNVTPSQFSFAQAVEAGRRRQQGRREQRSKEVGHTSIWCKSMVSQLPYPSIFSGGSSSTAGLRGVCRALGRLASCRRKPDRLDRMIWWCIMLNYFYLLLFPYLFRIVFLFLYITKVSPRLTSFLLKS